MNIGILGTGTVGRTLRDALVARGHNVWLGSRSASEGAVLFSEAAGQGEVVILAVGGANALAALDAAGADNLAGKVLIDISNPLGQNALSSNSQCPVNWRSVKADSGVMPSLDERG